jgi:hypothetical protein
MYRFGSTAYCFFLVSVKDYEDADKYRKLNTFAILPSFIKLEAIESVK